MSRLFAALAARSLLNLLFGVLPRASIMALALVPCKSWALTPIGSCIGIDLRLAGSPRRHRRGHHLPRMKGINELYGVLASVQRNNNMQRRLISKSEHFDPNINSSKMVHMKDEPGDSIRNADMSKVQTGNGWFGSVSVDCEHIGLWVRFWYEGARVNKDARLLQLSQYAQPEATSEENLSTSSCPVVGHDILAALRSDGEVDLSCWIPHVFSVSLRGWVVVTPTLVVEAPLPVEGVRPGIDVQLFRRKASSNPSVGDTKARSLTDSGGKTLMRKEMPIGYFQIGIFGAKHETNLGTLWRSAYQLGAAGTFVISSRLKPDVDDIALKKWEKNKVKEFEEFMHGFDTTRTWQRLPLVFHADWQQFAKVLPYQAVLVAVEMGGEPLETFEHPERALYILGSEDNGIPESILRACPKHVALPGVRTASFNVAVAGSILMYDRLAKRRRDGKE